MTEVLRWIHLLAISFFVGGQLLLVTALVPVLRGHAHMGRVARRFGVGSLAAIGIALVTGAAMASERDRWGDGTLHAKLGLLAVVAALVVVHLRRPDLHALSGAIFLGSLGVLALGVALAH